MKKILCTLAVCILGVNSVLAGSHIMYNSYNLYDRTRYSTVTSYICTFDDVQCSVEKVKLMQTGRTFYDSECTGSKFEQGRFKHRAASDVRLKRFDYCKIASRSIH